jgi:hypothetical protein
MTTLTPEQSLDLDLQPVVDKRSGMTVRVLSVEKVTKSWQGWSYFKTGQRDRVAVSEKGRKLYDAYMNGHDWINDKEETHTDWKKAYSAYNRVGRQFVQQLLDKEGRGHVKFSYVEGDVQGFVLQDVSDYGYRITITACTDAELAALETEYAAQQERNRRQNIENNIVEKTRILEAAKRDLAAAEDWDGKTTRSDLIKLEYESRRNIFG